MTGDGTRTYTWKHGRQLASLSDSTGTWNYTYDSDGLRTQRTKGSNTYRYVYVDGQLSLMTVNGADVYIAHDGHGQPLSLTYNGAAYFYVTNLQGDVVALVDTNGTAVVKYTYDAWGKQLSCTGTLASTIGTMNPLRYRGYVYDQETGLYYLQSRYYNPEIGRFINADAFVSTGQGFTGNNMFAYCNNNPVCFFDPSGDIAITTLILLGSAAIGIGSAAYTAYKEHQAGFGVGQIIGDSLCSGFSAFFLVYSLGLTANQCYQNYCYLNAITPVTEINIGTAPQPSTTPIPQAAKDTLAYIDEKGSPPQGYKGGKVFVNDGRDGGTILPQTGMPYHEYDIHPYIKGIPRGAERLVIGADKSVWYTRDHYKTFFSVR